MAGAVSRVGYYRWVICGLLFFAATINYVDRQVIGILKPTLQAEFGWSELDYGDIVFAFQLAYGLGFLVAGRVMDWLGTRRGFALAIVLWSLAAVGHAEAIVIGEHVQPLFTAIGLGYSVSVTGFLVVRFLLGLGEAGNFPAAIKTVAEWFPRRERALATGIFNSGTNIGALVTPIVVPVIVARWGWYWAFVLTGIVGFAWVGAWWLLYGPPDRHPRVSAEELALIRSDPQEPQRRLPYRALLPHRQAWAFIVGKFLTDPVWWLYLFWIPDFLHRNYGLNLAGMGLPLVVIYLVADIGSIGGGWLGVKGLTTIAGTGVIVNPGSTATAGAGMLNLGGGVSDSGNGFLKYGSGTLILGQSAAFTGTLDVRAGTVRLDHAAALSSGGNLIGSPITSLTNSTTTINSTSVTVSSTTGLVPGQIVNGAGIVAGSYIVSVDDSTHITISAPATASATTTTVNIGGASLDLNGLTNVAGNVTVSGFGQNVMIANATTPVFSNSTGALWNSSSTAASMAGQVTIGSPGTVLGGYGDLTFNGAINSIAANGLNFVGSGTNMMTVDNTSTLLGTVTASSGTILKVGHASALGATGATANTIVASGAVLDLNGFSIAEDLNVSGVGRANFGAGVNTLASLLNTSSTAATVSGAVVLGANSSLGANRINSISGVTNAGDITLSGAVTGEFTLTKVGANTLTLSNSGNTFNALTLTQGILIASGAGRLGDSGTVTVGSGTFTNLNAGNILRLDNAATASNGRLTVGNTVARAVTMNGGALEIRAAGDNTSILENLAGSALTINNAIASGAQTINHAVPGNKSSALANKPRRKPSPTRSTSSWMRANDGNKTLPTTAVNTCEGKRTSSYARA